MRKQMDESLLLHNFGFGLDEVLVQILSQQNLAVECGHLLVVVHQFLFVDLFYVAVLVGDLFELFLQVLVVDLLVCQFGLQLFVVIVEAGQL